MDRVSKLRPRNERGSREIGIRRERRLIDGRVLGRDTIKGLHEESMIVTTVVAEEEDEGEGEGMEKIGDTTSEVQVEEGNRPLHITIVETRSTSRTGMKIDIRHEGTTVADDQDLVLHNVGKAKNEDRLVTNTTDTILHLRRDFDVHLLSNREGADVHLQELR